MTLLPDDRHAGLCSRYLRPPVVFDLQRKLPSAKKITTRKKITTYKENYHPQIKITTCNLFTKAFTFSLAAAAMLCEQWEEGVGQEENSNSSLADPPSTPAPPCPPSPPSPPRPPSPPSPPPLPSLLPPPPNVFLAPVFRIVEGTAILIWMLLMKFGIKNLFPKLKSTKSYESGQFLINLVEYLLLSESF